jgi:hypothetical protein
MLRVAQDQGSKARTKEVVDADTTAGDDDLNEEEEMDLRISCVRLTGALMENHADIFAGESLEYAMQLVQRCFNVTGSEDDHRLGMYMVCEMLNHLGARITSQWPTIMPHVLQDIGHVEPEVRQPACYAVALAARNPAFAPMAAETAAKLSALIVDARSRAKKKSEKAAQLVADNALSALAEILSVHGQVVKVQTSQLWQVWLQALPCQEDEEEGVKNHKLLLEMLKAQRSEVIGDAGAKMPQVLSVLVQVYKTEMADDETSTGIGKVVLQLGQAHLEQMGGQLSEKMRKKLARIHREAACS